MANAGATGVVRYCETFATDNISTGSADGIGWAVSSDTGNTAFARAVAAALGLHAAGAVDSGNADLIEFCSDLLHFYAQTGFCAVEMLVRLDTVAGGAFNFGFNDDVLDASNLLPVTLSGTTWTSNAATFVGLVWDTDATNDDVHCFWVNGDSDTGTAIASLRMAGAAPAAGKWMRLRVELQDQGSGNGARATFLFAQDGKGFEKVFNTSVARDTALCFYFGFESRTAAGATVNVYLKTPMWEQSIED